jgi:Malectin domain
MIPLQLALPSAFQSPHQVCPVCLLCPSVSTYSVSTANLPASASPQEMYSTMVLGTNLTSTLSSFLTPGKTYFVHLYFCEAQFNSTAKRVFDILVNGVPIVSNLDVLSKAGAEYVSAQPYVLPCGCNWPHTRCSCIQLPPLFSALFLSNFLAVTCRHHMA